MKTRVEDISSVKKRLVVELESKEVDKKIDAAYRELGKKAKVPGFRLGKVPRSMLERRFGDNVTEDVSRDLINESFPKALVEADTMPLGTPLLEKGILAQGQDFKYSAVIEVRPRFDLDNYLGLEVEKEKYSVTDKDVADRIEQIRLANGNIQSIEHNRAIQKGDYVVLDYEAFDGDSPLNDVKATNFLIKVGSIDFHPQFEEGLIGLEKGEAGEINVHFEDSHYNSRLSGKSLKFKVKIFDIKEMVLPELNDEFAKNLGTDFNNIEGLKVKVHEMIVNQEEKRVDKELKERLLRKIADSVNFEYPQILIETEIDNAVENFKQILLRSGSSLEKTGIAEEKLRNDFRPVSEKRVKEMLVLYEIAKRDKIAVDEEDLAEGYKNLAAAMGLALEAVRKYYEARGLVEAFKEKLTEEKTLNYLIKNAKICEVERDEGTEYRSSEKESN